jgi:F-type H+-transporting ATPase subunit b
MNFLDERFWLAISFIIFIYLAYRPVKKAIITLLDDKVAAIKSKVLEAEGLKQDAKLLLEKVEQDIAHLGTLREEILQVAMLNANKLIKERGNEMEAFLERKKAEMLGIINNQKLQTCEQIQSEFVVTVTKLVTEYFKLAENSSLTDRELAKHLLDQNKSNDSIS